MESKAPVSPPPEQGTPLPPPPLSAQENGGGAATPHVEEDMESGGDDGFETASDPDEEDSAALDQTLPPRNPVSPVTGVDDAGGDENPIRVGENPSLVDEGEVSVTIPGVAIDPESPKGVLIENPNLDENSDEVFGVEEKGLPEALVPADFVDLVEGKSTNDEFVEAGSENVVGSGNGEDNGVIDTRNQKEENLGDGGSEAEASPVIEGEVVLNPVAVKSDAVGVVAEDENNLSPDPYDGKYENLDEIIVPVIEGAAELKPVDVVDKSSMPVFQDEQDENLDVVGSEEVTSSVIKGVPDSKPLEEESVVVEVEKDEATDGARSNKNIEGTAESNSMDVEAIAAEGVKHGDIDSTSPIQTLKGDAESENVEPESRAAEADEVGSDVGAGSVIASSAETLKSESTESKVCAGGADNAEGLAIVCVGCSEKDEGLIGGSVSVGSELAMDSAETYDEVNDGEAIERITSLNQDNVAKKVVPESDELISVQDVQSSPILEVESKSMDAEEVVEESGITGNGNICAVSGESLSPISVSDREVKPGAIGAYAAAASADDDDEKMGLDEAEEESKSSVSDRSARIAILESSETAKQMIKELEEGSSSIGSHSVLERSQEHSHHIDGQIVTDSDEEETDEEGEGREFDSAALSALLKAATGASPSGNITITSQDATRIFSANRPAGLGSSVPALKPASSRSSRPSSFTPSDVVAVGEPDNNMNEEEMKLQEKVEQIRVKFLRLVQRLGHSPEDTVAAQVLYRLGLAEGIRRGRQISRAFSIEHAKKKALQLEEEKDDDLDFSCNILILGKSGVGKSATINSIFGEGKSHTNAFRPATTSVREISGTVDGVKIRVLDTPGLRASVMDQAANRKILLSIKKYTKRCPPDIVLYVDRMDTQTRDFNDLHLLRSITSTLDSSIWYNAIVALSHAASAPPDGPYGSPLSYEVFVAQRSHVVQQSIRQAAGDMRLMNPVALVENHPSCRKNREGERVLPNGLSWRSQLLLLCYSSKILSEANSLLKLQDPSPGKLFGFRLRSPPLPFLLSSLLQSRAHPKLPTDQGGENADSDIDLDDFSDTDQEEEEDEYDQLPPFKPLRKSQIAKLTKEQRRAYFDEYDYRVKLLQKKQWKEEIRRMKEMKKRGKSQRDEFAYGDMAEDFDQDGAPAAVPVPLPDMVLPPSFDCDNPVYRYRFLEPTSQLLYRPVLDSHGWDHDCGYDGVSIEENLAIAGRFPAGVAVQITKDKKEFNIHLDSSIAAKHGENGSTLAGFDIQSIGKQLAYILRSETKFKNFKKNKTAAGISVTFLGETVATGLKIEDQISLGKRVSLVASTGAVRAQGDVAYGANLEARLREKDYPIGQALSTLGLSLMRWRGDLALGANLQSQFPVGRNAKMAIRVGLNNKLSGQITVRTSTSEQLQIALVGVLPLVVSLFRSIFPGESYMVH